jgi:deoxyadenosine/deoxycytidine kinase
MLYDTGFMEEIEYTIYNSFFEEIKISGIIYVKTTPEICSARIVHRGRKGEESINLDYLKDCHEYHEEWINSFEIGKIILDGNFQIDINFRVPLKKTYHLPPLILFFCFVKRREKLGREEENLKNGVNNG